jgi:hypothetical protein
MALIFAQRKRARPTTTVNVRSAKRIYWVSESEHHEGQELCSRRSLCCILLVSVSSVRQPRQIDAFRQALIADGRHGPDNMAFYSLVTRLLWCVQHVRDGLRQAPVSLRSRMHIIPEQISLTAPALTTRI